MKRTDAMVAAEVERTDCLAMSETFLHISSRPETINAEGYLRESIKLLMIGSHSGRVG